MDLKTTLKKDGEYFVVSTVLLPDVLHALDSLLSMFPMEDRADLSVPGDYETMVFTADEKGTITNYTELDFARYSSQEEAEVGHKKMVDKWEDSNDR